MHTYTIFKKILLFMSFYSTSVFCSEEQNVMLLSNSEINKDLFQIRFDNQPLHEYPLNSNVGFCFKVSQFNFFYIKKELFEKFLSSFKDPFKKTYIQNHKEELYQFSTIEDLVLFNKEFACIKISGISTHQIKKLINASIMGEFLKQQGMLNQSYINVAQIQALSNSLFYFAK